MTVYQYVNTYKKRNDTELNEKIVIEIDALDSIDQISGIISIQTQKKTSF
jgi:phage tail tube protein FII